jgi:hypothetical protein
MSNIKQFSGISSVPIVATEAPDWVRRMSDHYTKTGTVRRVDAARLFKPNGNVLLSANPTESRNSDDEA